MLRRLLLSVLLVTVVSAAVAADLPLRRVVLFSSGVGYFDREGSVDGNATVQLSFRTAQINDILKSMVLQDFGGGAIAPVAYAPQEPLARMLASFTVNIADSPPLFQLLGRLRGVRAELVADRVQSGTLMGVEKQQKSVGDKVVTFDVINLLTDAGLVQVPVWHLKCLRILDAKVDADLRKALGVIAASRDVDKRPVTLTFNGTGPRRVSVGYLLETPVWKTSYRLVVQEKGLFLQGWAIVENTTDDDWNAVNLSLVSGRPISFVQNLYEPLYVGRPVVPPSVAASARPQVYEGAVEEEAARQEALRTSPAAAPRPAKAAAEAGRPAGAGGGGMGGGGRGGYAAGGAFGGVAGYAGVPFTTATPTPSPALALRDAGVAAMAQAEKVGELFQYVIDQPVTIARQKSAMIPIVNKPTEGTKVSVYNVAANPKFPLNGIKLKNTTGLHLMGGPITVFDGGVYAGDALIEDIAPGDDRLLTYAVDLAVQVEAKPEGGVQQVVSVKVSRGVVVITRREQTKMTYTAKSVGADPRLLLIEHPVRTDWTLVEPKEASERTPALYRFRLPLGPREKKQLTVTEEHPVAELVALTDRDAESVGAFLKLDRLSDAVRAALQHVVELKTQLADIQRQRSDREARLKEITEEQARIRNNMGALSREAELYKRYVQKLTDQEEEFEKLQTEIKQLKADETKKLREVQEYIMGLNLE